MQQKSIMKLLSLIPVMLLASCANTTSEIKSEPVVIDTSCNWVKPIMISRLDDVTEGTAGQILAHNRKYDRNCPKKK